MRIIKEIVLFTLLILSLRTAAHNPEHLNQRFIDFFLKGDIAQWEKTIDSLRALPLDFSTEMILLYGEYGLIGNLIGEEKNEEAQKHLSLFKERSEKALISNPNNGDLHAFSAAAIAFSISLQPWKAPFLNRSHLESIRNGMNQGSNFGLPLVEQANSFYFRPAFVGGNKNKAIEYYEMAFNFFKNNQHNHWMYYNVAAWLGLVYAKQGMKAEAEAMYMSLLEEAPEFAWVRDELLPELRRKQAN